MVKVIPFAESEEVKLAERIAEQEVHQWEKHDRYRMTEGERVLFDDEKEPNNIAVARALLSCLYRMRLARCQYLGCGGRMTPQETVNAIHDTLDVIEGE